MIVSVCKCVTKKLKSLTHFSKPALTLMSKFYNKRTVKFKFSVQYVDKCSLVCKLIGYEEYKPRLAYSNEYLCVKLCNYLQKYKYSTIILSLPQQHTFVPYSL